ncbi:MAG: ATP-dependent RNA helicase RhlB [Gammaproteobacteria bacterium]
MKFSELDLEPSILRAVDEIGFEACTPIQSGTLPLALKGHDVAGQAQTGTGKTAAFLLALINRLLRSEKAIAKREARASERTAAKNNSDGADTPPPKAFPQAVVLAPTRELALQIHADAEVLGKYCGLAFGVVYGGTGYQTQRDMIGRGLDVLIGTPGRLIDYYKQGLFSLGEIEVVVLDEADRMFDLGFIKDIRYVLRRMPEPQQRTNMLFSATLSHRVMELAYEHMNDPEMVNVSPESKTVDAVTQVLYHVSKEEKIPLLLGLVEKHQPTRAIVFVNTKGGADRVQRFLAGNGRRAGLLSGDVPQRKRMRLLNEFQNSEVDFLVATDVAARGLHIPEVSHVYNFDLPQDKEDYVHRIGRTARAGATGMAVSFACEEYVFSLEDIQEYINQSIPTEQVTDELLVKPKPPTRAEPRPKPRHSDSGRRNSKPGGGRSSGGRSSGR